MGPTELDDWGDCALNDTGCELRWRPMGMTIIEKILARASGAAKVAPGDLAVVDVDLAVLIDLSFSRGSWREVLKVHDPEDRKSTRLNSSHSQISYAVFC